MRSLILLLAVVLLSGVASSQLLPLELETTIPLPSNSNVWDVVPTQNGYYVWMQVRDLSDPSPDQIIYGETESSLTDTVEVVHGWPKQICGYFAGEDSLVPHALFVTENGFLPSDNHEIIQSYNLSTGMAVSPHEDLLIGWGPSYDTEAHGVTAALFMPNAPANSTRLYAMRSRTSHHIEGWHEPYYVYESTGEFFPNLFDSTSAQIVLSSRYGSFAKDSDRVVLCMNRLHVAYSGSRSTNELAFLCFDLADSISAIWGKNYLQYDSGLPPYPIECTIDHVSNEILIYTRLLDQYGVFSSLNTSGMVWTSPISYNFWLAAECVGDNSAEEFLCYNRNNCAFDVWNASTGQWYGHTDTLTIPTDGAARIIGRYNDVTRRLVFRDGQSLKIYRFGVYLPTTPRPSVSPSKFALSSFPNPFNPTTMLSFSLPREARARIAVFDVLGREVAVLADNMFTAGEHRIVFDGSALPSGLYFARLQSGMMQATHKLLLMK